MISIHFLLKIARLSSSYISGDRYQLAGSARMGSVLPSVYGLVHIGPRDLGLGAIVIGIGDGLGIVMREWDSRY